MQRQPEANTVEVVDRVKAMLPQFKDDLPRDSTIEVLNDRSASIRDAVEDVQFTLLLVIALVIMVIFLFLRRLTATLIPGARGSDLADRARSAPCICSVSASTISRCLR